MEKEVRNCQNCKQDFTIEPEDFAFLENIKVPAPTLCPKCRTIRRMAFRNTYFLYKRKSDSSGQQIFSMIPESSPVKVYSLEEWNSDTWDPMDYSKDIDFKRPFLNQVRELLMEVPWRAKAVLNMENSDYSNNCSNLKNCYLCFNADYDEDCAYSTGISHSKSCLDVSHVMQCENSYECFWIARCHTAHYCSFCEDSYNIYFSKGLRGCHDCFGCVNLRGKQYCIFNKQCSKEEYEKKLNEFNLKSFNDLDTILTEAKQFWLKFPCRFREGIKNVDSTGEYVANSKNVKSSYLVRNGEDMKYCQYFQNGISYRDLYDCTSFGNGLEHSYECMQVGLGAYGLICSSQCWSNVKNLQYCSGCLDTSDSFGCVGLRSKQYCILNKQYTREEYESLVSKIIEHMNNAPYLDSRGLVYKYGEFFPIEFSPYAYNQTIAQDHFPIIREECVEKGYRWEENAEGAHSASLRPEDIPNDLDSVSENITKEVIGCVHEGKCLHQCASVYRILDSELAFYKRNNLALPRLCPNCRRDERLSQRNPILLNKRKCMCNSTDHRPQTTYRNQAEHFHGERPCPNEFETSYLSDRPEIVYCESCYQAEVA